MPWRSLRVVSRALIARQAGLTVNGLEFLPRTGPAIIAARHYHHLLDGAALLATIPRPVQVLVAADWAAAGPRRQALEAACRAAGWPTVLRAGAARPNRAAAAANGAERQLLRAIRRSVTVLGDGGLLLVFPEGYPTIDPGYTPKASLTEFLPFEPGFVRIAEIAARRAGRPVPIVPAGFAYQGGGTGERWRISLRFGAPLRRDAFPDRTALVQAAEAAVRSLSTP